MTVGLEKKLTKLVLRFGSIDPERAAAKQYELLKDTRVWRAFLNGYAKNGVIIFDEEAMPRGELLEKLKELEPEVVREERLTVQELIESSASWNNILGNMES
ncbi:DUF3213 domain-containing protein [Thermococcus sp. M36]|uniref:DUF3213 domain-containing protein n=1 Tax=Thermococcus sp. M36 TaxID=1638261 RepID=UPI00143B1794|nr:DUF3213 domain-containing protein [Thermococcus sp. M36]NJE05361.1 DUF3213 domain-containing protein [Thermococcus sp. M36]